MPGRYHPSSEKYKKRTVLREVTHNAEDSNQEDTDIDQDAQDSYERRSGSSRSSRKKKKQRKQRQPTSDDESSLTSHSSRSLPSSFKQNKENHRIQSNMAQTRRTRGGEKKSQGDDVDEKTIKLQELEIENAKLRQALKTQTPKVSTAQAVTIEVRAPKVGKLSDEERQWVCRLGDAFKKFNWSKVKFCNSEKKLADLTSNIFDKMPLNEFKDLAGDDLEAARIRWVAENKEYVRLAHGNIKNYAQSNLRNWVVKQLTAGKKVPTPKEVFECATREVEYHTDENKQEIFDQYHDVLLFKVCFKENWDTYVRHYNTISGAKNSEGEPSISISTEAFLVTLYHNSYNRFLMVYEHQRDGVDDKKRQDPRNNTPFIDSDAGQARWGGWNKEGRKYYREMFTKIKEAREKSHVEEMENACLERVRDKAGVDEKKKKSKKRKALVAEEESDDEFDCL